MNGLPIEYQDRLLLVWVQSLPLEERRARSTISRMRARAWSWSTIGQLTQLTPVELADIVRGDQR